MQTISLHDLVWVERTDCRVFEVVGTPINGENLVLKAARELALPGGVSSGGDLHAFRLRGGGWNRTDRATHAGAGPGAGE